MESDSANPVEEIIAVVFLWTLCGLIWWGAQSIAPPFFDPLGSAAVPLAVATIIAALSSVVLVRALLKLRRRRPAPEPEPDEGARNRPDLAFGILAVSAAYVGLMDFGVLGFRWATVFYIFAAGSLLGRFGRRTMLISAALALFLGIGCGLLFRYVFYIDLP